MGQERVTWAEVRKACAKAGLTIAPGKGSDQIIQGSNAAGGSGSAGSRNQVVVGHTSCRNGGTELLKVYVTKICRTFNLTIDHLKGRK